MWNRALSSRLTMSRPLMMMSMLIELRRQSEKAPMAIKLMPNIGPAWLASPRLPREVLKGPTSCAPSRKAEHKTDKTFQKETLRTPHLPVTSSKSYSRVESAALAKEVLFLSRSSSRLSVTRNKPSMEVPGSQGCLALNLILPGKRNDTSCDVN